MITYATSKLTEEIIENCKIKNQESLDAMLKENIYQTVLFGVPFRLADQFAHESKKYTYNDPRRLIGAMCEVGVYRLSQGHTFLGEITDKTKKVNGQTILLNKSNMHADITKVLLRSSDLFPQQNQMLEWYQDESGKNIPRLNQHIFYSTLENMNDLKIANRRMFEFTEYEGRSRFIHLPTYWSEYQIAQRIVTLLNSEKTLKTPKDVVEIKALEFGVDTEQAAAISEVFENKVSIITGGPGTGKSKAIEGLVAVLLEERESLDIRICAPTGSAAQNLQERLESSQSEKVRNYFNQSENKCLTAHRLLEVSPSSSLGVMRTKFSFIKDPLDVDVLIFEEASMGDIYLIRSLLWALPNHAHVVFVGDSDQLNSVGPGRVLYDLTEGLQKLQAKDFVTVLPKWSKLKQVHRTEESSRLPLLAKMLLIKDKDERWNYFKKELELCIEKGDVEYIQVDEPRDILNQTVDIYLERTQIEDSLALITSRHELTVGRIPLNEEIQLKLMNLIGFAKGVPVIQNRNNYSEGVMNGEKGVITEIKDGLITADFANDRTVTLSRRQAEDDWLIGYAITSHKSQGTEAETVILPIWTEENSKIWNSTILFTAMTRSKKKLIIVGNDAALERAIKTNASSRKTRLPLCYRSVLKKLK